MFIGLSYLSLFEFIDGIVQFIDLVYTRRLIDKFYLKRLKKKIMFWKNKYNLNEDARRVSVI